MKSYAVRVVKRKGQWLGTTVCELSFIKSFIVYHFCCWCRYFLLKKKYICITGMPSQNKNCTMLLQEVVFFELQGLKMEVIFICYWCLLWLVALMLCLLFCVVIVVFFGGLFVFCCCWVVVVVVFFGGGIFKIYCKSCQEKLQNALKVL